MKTFRYVFYGVINVKLSGHLHIGGEEEEAFSMATDGDGNYILPAGSIAGVVRKGISLYNPGLLKLFGDKDKDKDSSIWFYDAPLLGANVEKRTSTRINSDFSTAEPHSLHTMYFIGDGAEACIRMQGFAEAKKEQDNIRAVFKAAVDGIDTGVITFGAKRSSGAGTFAVTDAKCAFLDLTQEKDLDQYLKGVDACFAKCAVDVRPEKNYASSGTMFELEAMIPSGILVGSGEQSWTKQSGTINKVNITRTKDGNETAFIPGTAIKGMLREYVRKVIKELNLKNGILTDLFGEEDNKEKKVAGRVKTEDCDIIDKKELLYNRIQIDRWQGGTITSKKMTAKLIGTNKKPVCIKIWIAGSGNAWNDEVGKALVFLALRDLGTGLISLGSGESIGWGRLEGQTLTINGSECKFEKDAKGHGFIVCGTMEKEIKGWLSALEEK